MFVYINTGCSQMKTKMADSRKKRTVLALDQRFAALKGLDQGIPAYKVAIEMNVRKTQIQGLKKRKAEILKDVENNMPCSSKRRCYVQLAMRRLAYVTD